MQVLETGRLAIDQGSIVLVSDFANGGPMWAGAGPREICRPVRFAKAFERAPAVMMGVALWDFDNSSNLRADWTAIGGLRDPDRWAVE